MISQIPLHQPQSLPADWEHSMALSAAIPTEEQLVGDAINRAGMNSTALVCAVMHAFSTTTVPTLTYKETRGFFHVVLSLQFPDGFEVAARLPKLSTVFDSMHIESTVAMMTLARYHLDSPVPEVYAWHPTKENPVGAPYILMAWADGDSPLQKWVNSKRNGRTQLLDELASQHAKLAKPLPFQGIGSLYFAEPSGEHVAEEMSYVSISAYRLGPLSQGPKCQARRGRFSSWPKATQPWPSLRDFWLGMWQHEVSTVTAAFGPDRSTVIAKPAAGFYNGQPYTLGQFLDASQALLLIIQAFSPSTDTQPDFFSPCLSLTDFSFENMTIDRDTGKFTAFLDWDDVYVMPFLLCSKHLDDLCWNDGSGEQWEKDGCFFFLPVDEEGEGEIEEEEVGNTHAVDEEDTTNVESQSIRSSTPESEESQDRLDGLPGALESELQISEGNHRRRVEYTIFRRQYEQFLASRDTRFGSEGFWEDRKEPLKIQYLVMHGWIQWLLRDDWLKARAAELSHSI